MTAKPRVEHTKISERNIEYLPLSELMTRLHPDNPKSHDLGAIIQSYQTHGFVASGILDDRTGLFLAGHGRIQALNMMRKQGMGIPDGIRNGGDDWLVPVQVGYSSRNDVQAKAYIVADNKLTVLGGWNEPKLATLLQEVVVSVDVALESTGYDSEELDQLLQDLNMADEPTPDPGAQVNRAAESQEKWQVVRGDVWQVGKHRIMCGDSTCAEGVERLMGEVKADMVFTSPPYNSGNQATGAYNGNKIGRTDFKNLYISDFDDLSSQEYQHFLIDILNCLAIVVKDTSPVLWNVAYNAKSRSDYGHVVFSDRHPFDIKETIIWDKSVGMNISAKGILSRTCELIFLMSMNKKYFTNQTKFDTWWNVWRINPRDGDNMQNGHGASFPVELPKEGVIKFCPDNGNVYDPFLGSGTTIVACEQTGRVGYGMEISPEYVSVCLQRLSDMGLSPGRITNNQPTETGC